jgi:uncharacterized protein YjbI with pentapeptide repeats
VEQVARCHTKLNEQIDLYGIFPPSDLGHVDLSGANLSGANLSGADLSGADLGRTDLREAKLTGANLSSVGITVARAWCAGGVDGLARENSKRP